MKFWRQASDPAQKRYDRDVLPYLDSAYNLARWLAKNDDDASDIVQEACLRAFRNLDQCGTNARAWFLSIVRNAAYSNLARRVRASSVFADEVEAIEWDGLSPEEALLEKVGQEMVTRFIQELPQEFREVVILRDIEDLSYKEIAEITGLPIGTVMSRLNRARLRLQQRLSDRTPEERRIGL